jgi:hypothetical protein
VGQNYSSTGVSYEELGRFWGRNVRDGKSAHDQFIAFLRSDVANAPDSGRTLFQKGFVNGYGRHGGPVFAHALDEARRTEPQPPPPPPAGRIVEPPPAAVTPPVEKAP